MRSSLPDKATMNARFLADFRIYLNTQERKKKKNNNNIWNHLYAIIVAESRFVQYGQ